MLHPVPPSLRASLAACLSASPSPSLAYADVGVAEALRSLGASPPWLRSAGGVALMCDVESPRPQHAAAAAALAAGWRTVMREDGEEEDDVAAAHPAHFLILVSSPSSTAAASTALSTHTSWAPRSATLLATSAAADSPSSLRALAAAVEAGAGWPRGSLGARRLAGAEWAVAGEAAFFALPTACGAATAAVTAWPFDTPVDEEEGVEPSASATTTAAARSVGTAIAAGASDAGWRIEPFALGASPAAAAVAAAVAENSGGGQSTAPRFAVVVIDARTATTDLAAPGDHPLDRAIGLLPRAGNDVVVCVDDCAGFVEDENPPPPSLAPTLATILHAAPLADSGAWLDALLTRRSADARLLLRKWLREAARAGGRPPPPRGRAGPPTARDLAGLVASLGRGPPSAAAVTARARALGAAGALGGLVEGAEAWDRAVATRTTLDAAAADGGAPAAGRDAADALTKAVAAAAAGDGAPFNHALLLILAAFSCAVDGGSGVNADTPPNASLLPAPIEASLLESLTQALAQASDEAVAAWPWLKSAGRAEPAATAASLLSSLAAAASHRRHLPLALRPAPPASATGTAAPLPPPRLAADLARRAASRTPLRDARHASTSLRHLLAGGLAAVGVRGADRVAARPTPADCDAVVLFFVGGFTLADVRAAAAAAAAASVDAPSSARVLVAGTQLLSPGDVVGRVTSRVGV